MIWKLLRTDENEVFVQIFGFDLGFFNSSTGEMKVSLEEFVYLMYGNKNIKSVDVS